MKLIAGVDPGKYTGIAIIDLEGKVRAVKTFLQPSFQDILSFLLSKGDIMIVATDVEKPPSLVRRISSQLGAILYSPPKNIPKEEKDRIMREFQLKLNDHERDALSAAYIAFTSIQPRITRIKKRLGDPDFVEEVIERVLRGEQLTRTIVESFREEKKEERVKIKRRDDREVIRLRQRVGELQNIIEELRRKLEECSKRKIIEKNEYARLLEEKLLRAKKEKEMMVERLKELEKRIEDLENSLKRYGEKEEGLDLRELVETYRRERKQQLNKL